MGQVRLVEFAYPRKPGWTLKPHAEGIARALKENNITSGWLLGESFGSQILWALQEMPDQTFHTEGIILAGGFVRYPIMPLVHLARFLCLLVPVWFWHWFLKLHRAYSQRFRGVAADDAEEMLQRQWNANRETFRHRLQLIAKNDPRETARKISCPLYYLSGSIDPIVPWYLVQPWLRKNCPTLAGEKIFLADHNILGSATDSARQILGWIMGTTRQKVRSSVS